MSMDLYVWKAPLASSEDEAIQLLEREDEAFESSEDVARFYDELLEKYPTLESFDEEELDSAPTYWSVTPERSDRLIGMNLAWSVPDDALDDIVALARKYELVLFDPQGPSFHFPVALDVESIRRDPLVLRQALIGLLIGAAPRGRGVVSSDPGGRLDRDRHRRLPRPDGPLQRRGVAPRVVLARESAQTVP